MAPEKIRKYGLLGAGIGVVINGICQILAASVEIQSEGKEVNIASVGEKLFNNSEKEE